MASRPAMTTEFTRIADRFVALLGDAAAGSSMDRSDLRSLLLYAYQSTRNSALRVLVQTTGYQERMHLPAVLRATQFEQLNSLFTGYHSAGSLVEFRARVGIARDEIEVSMVPELEKHASFCVDTPAEYLAAMGLDVSRDNVSPIWNTGASSVTADIEGNDREI